MSVIGAAGQGMVILWFLQRMPKELGSMNRPLFPAPKHTLILITAAKQPKFRLGNASLLLCIVHKKYVGYLPGISRKLSNWQVWCIFIRKYLLKKMSSTDARINFLPQKTSFWAIYIILICKRRKLSEITVRFRKKLGSTLWKKN